MCYARNGGRHRAFGRSAQQAFGLGFETTGSLVGSNVIQVVDRLILVIRVPPVDKFRFDIC